ncbi:MAG TPA: hypothetical protein PKD99_00550, partial [Sphingopyxis sp.]|nr:hypothetical protein [Sphingopyxis sp.]
VNRSGLLRFARNDEDIRLPTDAEGIIAKPIQGDEESEGKGGIRDPPRVEIQTDPLPGIRKREQKGVDAESMFF